MNPQAGLIIANWSYNKANSWLSNLFGRMEWTGIRRIIAGAMDCHKDGVLIRSLYSRALNLNPVFRFYIRHVLIEIVQFVAKSTNVYNLNTYR